MTESYEVTPERPVKPTCDVCGNTASREIVAWGWNTEPVANVCDRCFRVYNGEEDASDPS